MIGSPSPHRLPPTSSCSVLMGHSVIFSIESTDVWAWLQHLLSCSKPTFGVLIVGANISSTTMCSLVWTHKENLWFLFACMFMSMKVESFNKTGRSTSYLCCDLQGLSVRSDGCCKNRGNKLLVLDLLSS